MGEDSKYGEYYCPACHIALGLNSDDPADWTCDTCGRLFDADTWMDEAGLRKLKADDDRRWSEAEASGLIVPRTGEAGGREGAL